MGIGGLGNIWTLLIILVVVLIVFGGKGRIPQLMKDMGMGINAFRKGLKEEDKQDQSSEELEDKPVVSSTAEEVKDTDKSA